jgi:hypothetical protein
MNLKQLTLAVSSLCAVAGASAGTFTFDMPLAPDDPPYSESFTVTGSFSDIFKFTAPMGAVDVSGFVNSTSISDLTLSLFDEFNNLEIDPGEIVAGGARVRNAEVDEGESYHFKVTGNVPLGSQGAYVFTAIAAPAALIPEPETHMLALAALAGAGLAGMRGRRRG